MSIDAGAADDALGEGRGAQARATAAALRNRLLVVTVSMSTSQWVSSQRLREMLDASTLHVWIVFAFLPTEKAAEACMTPYVCVCVYIRYMCMCRAH